MINKIEEIESLMNNESSQSIIDGLFCIKFCMDIIATGNEDLIKVLENGR
jgi:hypothetical protein